MTNIHFSHFWRFGSLRSGAGWFEIWRRPSFRLLADCLCYVLPWQKVIISLAFLLTGALSTFIKAPLSCLTASQCLVSKYNQLGILASIYKFRGGGTNIQFITRWYYFKKYSRGGWMFIPSFWAKIRTWRWVAWPPHSALNWLSSYSSSSTGVQISQRTGNLAELSLMETQSP